MPRSKIPVLYVGVQEGFKEQGIPDMQLVDTLAGFTYTFNPDKHIIVGLSESAKQRGTKVPKELTSLQKKKIQDS